MGFTLRKKPEEAKNELQKIEIKEPVKQIETPKGDRIIVVKELPMKPVREFIDDDGVKVHLFTIEEYLTEQANQD